MPELKTSEKSPLETLKTTWGRDGNVSWIGVRPARREPLLAVTEVEAVEGRGLEGDHAVNKKAGGKRQVTLIQAEHIEAMALMLEKIVIDPGLLRRNIVVSGIDLISLKGQQVRIGDALLEITGPCHPCSRMEKNLGTGGYNAMRGHGGWCAKVIKGGKIQLGDSVGAVQ